MAALLIEIVTSDEFWSPASRWALIKSPVHLAVGACRQLEVTALPLADISRWLTACGQTLFDTPNGGEGGWRGHDEWLKPAERLAVRYQLPFVLAGRMPQLGIQAADRTARPVGLPVGTFMPGVSPRTAVTRLDPAPGSRCNESCG